MARLAISWEEINNITSQQHTELHPHSRPILHSPPTYATRTQRTHRPPRRRGDLLACDSQQTLSAVAQRRAHLLGRSGGEHHDTPSTTAMAAFGEELLNVVNKLQDLVFNTIGNDSLDLPQIVRNQDPVMPSFDRLTVSNAGRRRFAIIRQIVCSREHRRSRLPSSWQWHRHPTTTDSPTYQPPLRTKRQARRA